MVMTRAIFVRSLKHYINEILRGCGLNDVHLTLAHVFNIIFSDDKTLTHMTLGTQTLKNKVKNSPNVDKNIKDFSPEGEKITPP